MADGAGDEVCVLVCKRPRLWHRVKGDAGEAVRFTALVRLDDDWLR